MRSSHLHAIESLQCLKYGKHCAERLGAFHSTRSPVDDFEKY